MIIQQITLKNFRNHSGLTYRPEGGVNIICGQNGRGKTNILEAVYLLTGVKSWRAASRQELIEWNRPHAQIRANVQSRSREFEIVLDLPRSARASAKINGVSAGRDNPLSGTLRAVLFSPEDLSLVKGPPAGRRELMDSALSQLFPRYRPLAARYSRLILSKGKLLREAGHSPQGLEILPEINSQIASAGAKIIAYRARFCSELGQSAAALHSRISQGRELLSLEYKTASSVLDPLGGETDIENALLCHLRDRAGAEIAAGSCLVGPHRDDIEISINGKPVRAFASQGQARSAALALRFAQREIFRADLGEHPLLLLDDILSELDRERQDFVRECAPGGQSIITCCTPEQGFGAANVLFV